MHAYRTHNCGQLRETDVGNRVRLSGWVHRKRDHGGVLFVDLRDHYGLTQIVCRANSEPLAVLEHLRAESVVTIEGEVVSRGPGATNPNLPTGAIEIVADSVTVQSAAEELPLPVAGEADYPEDIRLRYRYLDLRRDRLHANILLRSQVIASIRRRMIDQGFTEFQTPILTASSPEGARDYLVPSRVHPGKFYALPQAPQMFKQLIMVAGFDRYFQIAPCFRDEDARADRSPGEFYQLDFEMSFVTQDDVFEAIEPVLSGVFEEFANGRKVTPAGQFPRIPYREAMLKYGSDKPDLRFGMELTDLSEELRGTGFGVFKNTIEAGGVVRAICVKGAASLSRSQIDGFTAIAKSEGAGGLAYLTYEAGEVKSPIAKFLSSEELGVIKQKMGAEDGDAVFGPRPVDPGFLPQRATHVVAAGPPMLHHGVAGEFVVPRFRFVALAAIDQVDYGNGGGVALLREAEDVGVVLPFGRQLFQQVAYRHLHGVLAADHVGDEAGAA